jgi:hypothetical protein
MEEDLHPAEVQQHVMLREQNRQLVAKARAKRAHARAPRSAANLTPRCHAPHT